MDRPSAWRPPPARWVPPWIAWHGCRRAWRSRAAPTPPAAAAEPKADPWGQALTRSRADPDITGLGTAASTGIGGDGSRSRGAGPRSGTGPRIVPMSPAGSLGPTSRAQRRRETIGKPPWEPASLPEPRVSPLQAADGSPRPSPEAPLPPWEQVPGEFAAAPVPADLPDGRVSTGPMYVWNPLANTAPQPAVPEDEDERFR